MIQLKTPPLLQRRGFFTPLFKEIFLLDLPADSTCTEDSSRSAIQTAH